MFGQGNLAPQFRGNGHLPPPLPPQLSMSQSQRPLPPIQFQQGHHQLPPPPPPPFLQGHSQLPPPPPPPFHQGHSQSRVPPPLPFQQGHCQFPPPPFQQGHSQLPPPPPPPNPYYQQGHSQVPPSTQFQQGHTQLPPSHHLQQNPSSAGTPPLRQPPSNGLPPPPPPPPPAQLHPIDQRPHIGIHPSQYPHGLQRPMPPSSGVMGTGQSYMQPPASNYGGAPVVNSYYPYPLPVGTHNFHNVTATATLPSREPPPASQGNVSNTLSLLPPSVIQHIPTPPPPAPIIPESFVLSNVGYSSLTPAPPASQPQPPPPPPPLAPSSPPPPPPSLPSSPPPSLPSSPPPPLSPPPPPPPTSEVEDANDFPRDHYLDDASVGDSLHHNSPQVKAGSIDRTFPKLVVLPSHPIELHGNAIQNIKDSITEQSGLPPHSAAVSSALVNSDMDMDDETGFPYSEDISAPNSPIIIVDDEIGSSRLKTEEVSPSKVTPPVPTDENPFQHIQGYASDDSSEDAGRNYLSDVSPVNVTVLKASPMKAIEVYDNLDSNNTPEMIQAQTYTVPISSSPHKDDKINELVCHQQDIHSPDDKFEDSECSNDATQQDDSFQHEECKIEDSTALKVDEFGRMVREGVSDSDSDGNRYKMRYARRRKNSNTSPQRRKNKRSRSPSSSPRRTRVRNKSPLSSRHSSGFVKRERSETPQCFNFLRRRCHRGASCRYLHHEHGQYRSQIQENQDILHVSDNQDITCHSYQNTNDSIFVAKENQDTDRASISEDVRKIQEFPSDQVKSFSDIQTPCHEISDRKNTVDFDGDGQKPTPDSSDKDVQDRDYKDNTCEQEQDALLTLEAPKQYAKQDVSQDPEGRVVILAGEQPYQSSPVNYPNSQSVPPPYLQPEYPSITNGCMLSTETHPHDPSTTKSSTERTYLTQTDPTPIGQPSASSVPDHSQPLHSSEMQSYTIPSSGHEPHPSQLPQSTQFPQHIFGSDYNYGVPPQNSVVPPQNSGVPPQTYGVPPQHNIPQHFHFGGSSRPIIPNTSHIPHDSMPLESKFQSMPDYRPSFVNHQVQAFGTSNFVRADQPSHPSISTGTQFSFGHLHSSHSHPIGMEPADPFQQQSFSRGDFHDPGSFHYSQQQFGNPHQPASGTFPNSFGMPNSTSSHFTGATSNIQYGLPGTDIMKTSNVIHFNPFASTFERPMTFGLESTNYGSQSQIVSTVDKYDPLFDSIDATPRLTTTSNHIIDKALVGSSSGVNDELGETATDAEVGVVEDGSPLLGNNLEWSPGNPIDMIDPASGEVDLERVPSPGKSKKSKDSRFTKLFKVAVADFVKEVLKPSWRQGNLSKEAFKTIVKKTVDKVSSTMPSHHVPKTKDKIDQYVESSQKKLTKLVMGYVDKYVKM